MQPFLSMRCSDQSEARQSQRRLWCPPSVKIVNATMQRSKGQNLGTDALGLHFGSTAV